LQDDVVENRPVNAGSMSLHDFALEALEHSAIVRLETMRVGAISDTHGLLRPEAVEALRGSDLIIHAGDVGKPEILDALRELAPVYAVRRNVDRGEWANRLLLTEIVEVTQSLFYILHDLSEFDLEPSAAGFAAVISGHSHQPYIREENGVLYLNPGSAGPRRFRLPVSVAEILLAEGRLEARLIELDV